MDHLKIGIIGYGRLGKFYAKYFVKLLILKFCL